MPKCLILEAGAKVYVVASDTSTFTTLVERSIGQIQREEEVYGFKEILLLKSVSGANLLTLAPYAFYRIPAGGFTIYSDFNSAWHALTVQSPP